jgi:hypothetical protein
MRCTGCGVECADGARFCASCGTALAAPVAGAVASETRREQLRYWVTWAAEQGARIESQSDYNAQVVQGQKVGHLLHFFIGLFTCGLWWFVWLLLGMTGGEHRTTISVDERGQAFFVGHLQPPQQAAGFTRQNKGIRTGLIIAGAMLLATALAAAFGK